ncbi:hypothetical protein CO172_02855 [Candidatus Uhrbacteria bacterium CG_4_9_14_3_um_filter_36_7]|uniref:Uncharacterized protein n=1 Tax=Candidatus Uhrbacteria bacterium CG_4_9_14_3_um_filter_36_7 TaxID=1975033 RepID=A0A2M7XH22_9BACT|nr:MAG: hypothetical protein CO172_02855 [Candidatus Uhrbacteria bacterium CG_4_9_14_3_um_filter_36_7]
MKRKVNIIQEENFKGLIENKNQFADYIKNVIKNPTEMEKLNGGRVKYWDAKNQGVIIYDPKNPDQGTAFQAWNGKESYDKIK